MPVLIAAHADELALVRRLATRLRADGGEVRCFLEEDDGDLRALGCKIAVGSLDDEMNLEASLTNVHTFIPIVPDPAAVQGLPSLAALEAFGRVAAGAAGSAGIEQTILPLPAVAGVVPGNPLAEAYARIERMFVEACRPICVLRTAFVWGPGGPFTAAVRGLGARGGALPDPTVAVVRLEDLAAVVAAADDREGIDGTWDFGGYTYRLSELVELAGGPGPVMELTPWMLEILASAPAVGSSAEEEFEVKPEPPA